MIEYQRLDYPWEWYVLTERDFICRPDDFRRIIFRVDGAEFIEWNAEFEHALLIERLSRSA